MPEHDEKICTSCTMPIESGRLCRYCADDHGDLRAFDEVFARMMQWTRRQQPELASDAAERQTREFMRSMPAWRDHPALRGDRG